MTASNALKRLLEFKNGVDPGTIAILQVETLQKGQLTLVHFSRCHDFQKGRTLDRGIETTDCGSSDADF